MSNLPNTPRPDLHGNSAGFQSSVTPYPPSGRKPLKLYRVVQDGCFVEHHEGFGLTLDAVIAHELPYAEDTDEPDSDRDPFDIAIFDGRLLVALVHCGRAWGEHYIFRFTATDGQPILVPGL